MNVFKKILRRTMIQKHLLPSIARLLSFTFIFTNIAFSYKPAIAANENIWSERKKSYQVAALPENLLMQTPAVTSPINSVATLENTSPFEKEAQKIVNLPVSFLQHVNVREVYRSGQGAPVIIMEDVHANVEAQTRLSEALKAIAKQKGDAPILVGLEGANGKFIYDLYQKLPNKELAIQVADSFMKSGEISGPAHAGFTTYPEKGLKGLTFWGIDDKKLYRENLDAYRSSHKSKNKVVAQINTLRDSINKEKQKTLNPDLKKFDDVVTAYHLGQLQMGEYVEALVKYNLPTSLTIDVFHQAYQMETSLDFNKVEQERAKVIEALVSKMSKPELETLTQVSLGYQEGTVSFAQYYAHLKKMCENAGVSLAATPDFDNYIRYVLMSDGIAVEKLILDLRQLENDIYAILIKSNEEKDLINKAKHVNLMKDLSNFSLSAYQWADYKTGNVKAEDNIDMSVFEKFYEAADARNNALVQNLNQKIASLDKNSNPAVMVMGGYHTLGVKDLLKQKKISYIIATPKLSEIDENETGSSYLSVFDREKSSLDELFSGKKLFMVDTPAGSVDPLNPIATNMAAKMTLFQMLLVEAGKGGDGVISETALNVFQQIANLSLYAVQLKRGNNDSVEITFKVSDRNVSILLSPIQEGESVDTRATVINNYQVGTSEGDSALLEDVLNALKLTVPQVDTNGTTSEKNPRKGSAALALALVAAVPGVVILSPLFGSVFEVLSWKLIPAIVLTALLVWGILIVLRKTPEQRADAISSEKLEKAIAEAARLSEVDVKEMGRLLKSTDKDDKAALAKIIQKYNQKVGGLDAVIANRTVEETVPEMVTIKDTLTDAEQEAQFNAIASGKRGWIVFAGGAASRLDPKGIFASLGLGGLTGKILKKMKDLGLSAEDLKRELPTDAFSDLIDRAQKGVVEDLDDLSLIQRQILRLQTQVTELYEKFGEKSGMKLEDVLSKLTIDVTVNAENIDAVVAQLKAIRFPGKIYVVNQPKVGVSRIDENGQVVFDAQARYPEGHARPFVQMTKKSEGVYELRNGVLKKLKTSLMDEHNKNGLEHVMFGQVNDMHMMGDPVGLERWDAAITDMQKTGAEMVLEMVENPRKEDGTFQKGGGAFGLLSSLFGILRDKIAMDDTTPLSPFAARPSISRMFYVISVDGLRKLDESKIPEYLTVRGTSIGLEAYSGDATSVLKSRFAQQEGFKLYTFKERAAVERPIKSKEDQNRNPTFSGIVQNIISKNASKATPRTTRVNSPALVGVGLLGSLFLSAEGASQEIFAAFAPYIPALTHLAAAGLVFMGLKLLMPQASTSRLSLWAGIIALIGGMSAYAGVSGTSLLITATAFLFTAGVIRGLMSLSDYLSDRTQRRINAFISNSKNLNYSEQKLAQDLIRLAPKGRYLSGKNDPRLINVVNEAAKMIVSRRGSNASVEQTLTHVFRYLVALANTAPADFNTRLNEFNKQGKTDVLSVIHIGRDVAKTAEDVENLKALLKDLAAEKSLNKDLSQNAMVVLHNTEMIDADLMAQIEAIVSASDITVKMNDTDVPVNEQGVKLYSAAIDVALAQGLTANKITIALQKFKNGQFGEASFRIIDRQPGDFELDPQLRAVAQILMNIANAGWYMVPVEDTLEAARVALMNA
ncbi:MAG: hypothetical protein ACKVQC_10225 [Elusimicrobiota bacterium]